MLRLTGLALAAALVLGTGAHAQDKEPYRIGAILPLTGTTADYGSDFRKGTALAEKEINAAGGIDGHPIEIVYGDSKNQAREGVGEFHRIAVVEGVPAIISTMSGVILPQFAPSAESGTPLLAVGATSPEIRDGGPTVFSNFPLADDEEKEIAEYAYNTLGFKKAAMIYENSAYGESLSKVFMERFRELGGEIVVEEIIEKGGRDFRSQLTRVSASEPPLIVTYAYYAEAGLLVRQAAELGIEAQFISHGAVQNAAFAEIAGDAAEGFISGAPRWDENSPAVQEFIKRYNEEYGSDPDLYGPYFYDAVHLIADAIKRGGYSKEGILEGLNTTKDFPGITGTLNFGPDGVVKMPLTYFRFENGKWVRI